MCVCVFSLSFSLCPRPFWKPLNERTPAWAPGWHRLAQRRTALRSRRNAASTTSKKNNFLSGHLPHSRMGGGGAPWAGGLYDYGQASERGNETTLTATHGGARPDLWCFAAHLGFGQDCDNFGPSSAAFGQDCSGLGRSAIVPKWGLLCRPTKSMLRWPMESSQDFFCRQHGLTPS